MIFPQHWELFDSSSRAYVCVCYIYFFICNKTDNKVVNIMYPINVMLIARLSSNLFCEWWLSFIG